MTLEGQAAPTAVLPDDRGWEVRLPPGGRWAFVWWYPKASTPRCKTCGQAAQQNLYQFEAYGCSVLGVSYDSPVRNRRFAGESGFTFPLLTATPELAEAWGCRRGPDEAWQSLPRRRSFLVDPEGVVAREYVAVDVATHVDEVLSDLRRLRS